MTTNYRNPLKNARFGLARSGMAVFVGLSVIIPFINHFRVAPSGSFHSEVAAAFFFFWAVLASVPLLPGRLVRIDPLIPIAASVLGLIILGHWLASSSTYAFAPVAWLSLIGLFLVAFAWGQVVGQDEAIKDLVFHRLSWAILIAASANGLAQLIQISGYADQFTPFIITLNIEGSCRVAGNVNQANHANTLAWMGLGAVVFLQFKRKLPFFLFVAIAALMLISSALTTSRTAWLFAVAVTIVAILASSRGDLLRRRHALVVSISLLAGVLVASLASGALLGEHCTSAGERFLSDRERAYNAQRLDFARNALAIWRDSPLLGVGVGRFRAAAFEAPVRGNETVAIDYYAHNIFLQFLAELGLVGLGVLVAVCIVYTKRLVALEKTSPAFWLAAFWALLIGLHSLVENAFAYAFFIIPVATVLGAVLPAQASQVVALAFRPRIAATASAVLGLVLVIALTRDYHKLTYLDLTASIAFGLGAQESPDAAHRLQEIRREIWFYAPYADLTLLGMRAPSDENVDAVRLLNNRVEQIFPTAQTTYYGILIATLDGDLGKAGQLVRKMKVFFPAQSEEYFSKLSIIASEHARFSALKSILSGA